MVDKDLLHGKQHVHFIGIGGSGMFPLVQILHAQGYYITGSDNNETDTTIFEREQMGIPVTIGQRAENIEGADLIVYTAAILKDNEELLAAKASGVPCIERCELLGLVTSWFDDCICVCGTHGKTTTTSLLTQILLTAGLDPSAVVGGKLNAIGGSGRLGQSDHMVCEACEYVDTFLHLYPDVAVILNIDADHLDYFGTVENIIRSFHKFASMTSKLVLVNGDDANSMQAVEGITAPVVTFGWSDSNHYYPANIRYGGGKPTEFDLCRDGQTLCHLQLKIPGRHNILNATAAAAAAFEVGAAPDKIEQGVQAFSGTHRRFEVLGEVRGITIADDYAHHPAELAVTLKAAKEMGYARVWAVFQPFTYSRTATFLDEFAQTLSIADRVVLSEIMGSREKNTIGIYAKDLAAKIDGCVWFPTFDEIADYVMREAQAGDLVITLGCGDIYKCAKLMLQK